MTDAPIDTFSPQEYLEYLQHTYYGRHLPPFAAEVGDVLAANILASLPPEHRKQLDRIAIGVLPTKSINAWVRPVPSGGEVISFDFGILSFMLALNKILLSRIALFGFEPTLEFHMAAKRAVATVHSFYSATEELPRLTVAPRKMLVASSISNVQSSFIVGHELGHILLGHFRKYSPEAPPDHPHAEEFGADSRGAELVISAFRRIQDPLFGTSESALGQAGIDIFFTYMIFMERVLNTTEIESPTHPSSKDRQRKLRDRFWGELPENARELATVAEKTFEAFAGA